ncbi:MAG: MurR/RpiR family transcriptional regulator [Rhizobiaceae bacterium]
MDETVSERVAAQIGAMPGSERKAAQALTANYPFAALGTVAEFAANAGVSAPSVLRFVGRIGFSNYAEFQAALKGELAHRVQSPFHRAASAAPGDAGAFIEAVSDNLRETFRHLSGGQIADMAARMVKPGGRVFLVGGRFTDGLARYLAAHLSIIRPDVHHLAGIEATWRDRLIDISRRDLVIVFDIRRYSGPVARFARAAHGRGATIVLFTDQWMSPVAALASHVVAARTTVPSPWDSSVALFAAAELVLGEATRQGGRKAELRMAEVERLRAETAAPD